MFSKKTDRYLDVYCDFLDFVLIDYQIVTADLEEFRALSNVLSKYLHINAFLKKMSGGKKG